MNQMQKESQAVRVPLTRGYKTLIDEADLERVSRYSWHANMKASGVYAAARIDNRMVGLHRFIVQAAPGFDVDHINGNRLDNRRCNLRLATRSQNLANSRPRRDKRASRFKGVTYCNDPKRVKRWVAKVASEYVGRFLTEVEAARAYDEVARIRYGAFARTNFPEAA